MHALLKNQQNLRGYFLCSLCIVAWILAKQSKIKAKQLRYIMITLILTVTFTSTFYSYFNILVNLIVCFFSQVGMWPESPIRCKKLSSIVHRETVSAIFHADRATFTGARPGVCPSVFRSFTIMSSCVSIIESFTEFKQFLRQVCACHASASHVTYDTVLRSKSNVNGTESRKTNKL